VREEVIDPFKIDVGCMSNYFNVVGSRHII
jgi:hypothetical protein